MVTIKDIAKLAGVSHGTVSNVLNKRGNVSASKIRLVEETAQMLGYSLNSQAQSLRKGQSNKIMVYIPYSLREKYYGFYDGLHLKLAHSETPLEMELIYFDQMADCQVRLERGIASFPLAIICVGFVIEQALLETIDPQVTCYVVDYPEMAAIGGRVPLVNFDYPQIWQELGQALQMEQASSCLFVTEWDLVQAEAICAQLAQIAGIAIEPYCVEQTHYTVELLRKIDELDQMAVIIATSRRLAEHIQALFDWLQLRIKPRLIVMTDQVLVENRGYHCYQLDYKRLGYLVGQGILATQKEAIPLVAPLGFMKKMPTTNEVNAPTLRLLTIKSPMTEALTLALARFKQESGIEVIIDAHTYDELYEMLVHQQTSLAMYDLIRLDSAWISSIATQLFQSLDERLCQEIAQELLPSIQSDMFKSNAQQWVVPLDLSVQLLLYRKDLFENPLIRRQYFELTGEQLEVPTNFHQFDRIAQFFTQSLNESSPTAYGHTITGQKAVVSANDILPRLHEQVAQASREVDWQTVLAPTFDQYGQSLSYLATNRSRWWGDTIQQFATGQTAMEIIFSNYASSIMQTTPRLHKNQIGVNSVPGNLPLIGGGVVGMTQWTKQKTGAEALLRWLYRADVAQMLTHFGGFLPVKSVVQSVELLELFPWLESIEPLYQTGVRSKIGQQAINFNTELEIGQQLLNYLAKLN